MRTTNTNSSCHTPYVLALPLTLNVADRIPHGVAPAIDLHTFARNYQMQILSMSFSWAYVRYCVELQNTFMPNVYSIRYNVIASKTLQ